MFLSPSRSLSFQVQEAERSQNKPNPEEEIAGKIGST